MQVIEGHTSCSDFVICVHNCLLVFQVSWDALERAFTLYLPSWIHQLLHELYHLQKFLNLGCWTLLTVCYIICVQTLRLQNLFCDFCAHATTSLPGIQQAFHSPVNHNRVSFCFIFLLTLSTGIKNRIICHSALARHIHLFQVACLTYVLISLSSSFANWFNIQALCILYTGQAFRYSSENAFYIFNQQVYFII